jgi:tRNA(Ile)-lysidine synthase
VRRIIPTNKTNLESEVLDFIRRHELIPPKKTVVIGVSGGADSVCLLHVLASLRKELGIRLHAAHLNHQLRGSESEADSEYVSNLAYSLGIPITADRQDVAAYRAEVNCSIEEAARELRYAFLARVARDVGANRVAVGHTRDDQVETILMHILRGTGTSGLRGLVPCSPFPYDNHEVSSRAGVLGKAKRKRNNLLVARPLLDITREETLSYCRDHQLAPRIDSSNQSLSFFRNRLRLQLLPLLRQYNPNIDHALLRLADIAAEDSALIEEQVSALWDELARQEDETIYLDRKRVESLPVALQRHLLRTAVTRLAGDARDIEAVHIEAARTLLRKAVGKRVSLPHGLVCYGEYDDLAITRLPLSTANRSSAVTSDLCTNEQAQVRQSQLPPSPFPPLCAGTPLKIPGETAFPGWKVVATVTRERPEGAQSSLVAHFDFRMTGTELVVRRRRAGDRFQPLGMSLPKKLYEFMIDAKIPRSWRDSIPIVCSPQQIVWAVGWRIDDRVRLTRASREILRLEFIASEMAKPLAVIARSPSRKDEEAIPEIATPRRVGAPDDKKSQTPIMTAVESELRLRRLTVEEALWRLDQYLYDAFMAGLSIVRIVHGKGTGALRYAIHESLAKHPLVKSYRLGGRSEGGYGVTIVELTNR